MAEIATSEVLISELPAREVKLSPTQATVVREIQTTVQPGQNQITILGLDARVNRDSIRIEGSGATITDIQTSIVVNPAGFYDSHASDSEFEELASEDEDVSEDEESLDDLELQTIRTEIEQVEEELALAQSRINSLLAVLNILDEYGKGLQKDDTKEVKKLEEFLDAYAKRRDVEAAKHHAVTAEVTVRRKDLARLQRKFDKHKTRYLQEQRAASGAIRQRNKKCAKEREQKKKQRERRLAEKRYFWAMNVGQVVVSLDTRGDEKQLGSQPESASVMLRLSYIIPGSGWFPRYDLSINSPSSTARMSYRAEFRHSSTEIWRDAKVTLSTSHASFSGLSVRIPCLDTWNIKLAPAASASKLNGPSWGKILDAPRACALFSSPAPQVPTAHKGSLFPSPEKKANMNMSSGLFGSSFGNVAAPEGTGENKRPRVADSCPVTGSTFLPQGTSSLFGGSSAPTSVGSDQAERAKAAQAGGLFGSSLTTSRFGVNADKASNNPPVPTSPAAQEPQPAGPSSSSLFSQLVRQHRRRYSIPPIHFRTPRLRQKRLRPDNGPYPRKLDLNCVALEYVIFPKHRDAAFLRARIKNTSFITLQPGQVGITVGGSFIGTANFEACGPNAFFNISLGIDPGIQVKHAKPTVKPFPGAIFFNKDGATFRRSCRVKNTKSIAVHIVVLDQVPVSDDEKLPVRLLQPTGLEKDGDESPLPMEKKKGHGMAALLKNDEVKWALRLEPKEEVRLILEYETKMPSGRDIVSA
ncbi:hypothetical protein BDW71DRAFT_215953 [Aspergillus fruticulosus]